MQAVPVVGSLFSAVSSFGQAANAKAAGKAQYQQAKMQAEDIKIRAMQEDTARIQDLVGTLSTINASLAGRGVGTSLDSGTGQAIEKKLQKDARENRLNVRGSAYRQQSQTLYAGRLAEYQGKVNAMGYMAQGVGSLFSAAQSAGDIKLGSGGTVGSWINQKVGWG